MKEIISYREDDIIELKHKVKMLKQVDRAHTERIKDLEERVRNLERFVWEREQ